MNDTEIKQSETVVSSNVANVDDVMQYFEGHTAQPLQVDTKSASNEPPKKKRGRPAGSTKTLNDYQPNNVIQNNSIISGALFITMVDLLIPMVLAFINNKTTKKKVDASELQLTEKQKKDLEPICNEVVKLISFGKDPVTMLFISLIGIYGFNLMAIRKTK